MKIHAFQNIAMITIPLLSGIKANCAFNNEVKDYPPKMNILLITADDLNWNSCGFAGCRVENITPNIDKLFYVNRVSEELYDYEKDPHALRNLIDDPDYFKIRKELTAKLERTMIKTHDPALKAFRNRNIPACKIKYMELQKQIIKDKHSIN